MSDEKINLYVEDHDLLDYEDGDEDVPYDPADEHLLDISDQEEAGLTSQASEPRSEKREREKTPGNQAGTSGMVSASPRGALKSPQGEPTSIFYSRDRKRKRIRTTKKRAESKKSQKYRGDLSLKVVQYHSAQEVIFRRRGEEDQKDQEQLDLQPFPDPHGEW